jgi:predicted metal-dependent hydrolase
MNLIYVLFLVIVAVIVFVLYNDKKKGLVMVESNLDGKFYLVQNKPNKQDIANLLASIRKKMLQLSDHLYNNQDKEEFKKYKEYIGQLNDRIRSIVISENGADENSTSYSINKGEQIVFCVRSKDKMGEVHDINLIMYVVIHELAHVACPEYGHTALFNKIFKFMLNQAIELKIYSYIDFKKKPEEYCGMMITTSII